MLHASICSEMTGQWSDRSAMSGHKTLSPPGPMSYLCGLALRIWTSFWRREDSNGMDMWNAPMVQSRQPLTYSLMASVGLGGPRWHGSSWQRGIAESGSSQLSTLMIDVPGDLVWDLPCVQQASYLEGGPLMWMLPLYLHVNQKSDYDMIWSWNNGMVIMKGSVLQWVKHRNSHKPNSTPRGFQTWNLRSEIGSANHSFHLELCVVTKKAMIKESLLG